MKIAILGAGNIGSTLGKKWTEAGHGVVFGVRDAGSDKARALGASFPAAQVDTLANALAGAEVVLLAIPSKAVTETVQAHASELAGKIILDATNDFGAPVVNHVAAIQNAVPTARAFRAFNSLGWEIFANPRFGETPIDHFYCGPDDDARPSVEKLIAEIGLRPIWVGGHELLPVVDALGALWVTLAFQREWGRGVALKLLQR